MDDRATIRAELERLGVEPTPAAVQAVLDLASAGTVR